MLAARRGLRSLRIVRPPIFSIATARAQLGLVPGHLPSPIFWRKFPVIEELTGNFAKLTGNLYFFEPKLAPNRPAEPRNSGVLGGNPDRKNREYESQEQGIRNAGTGNTNLRNREYKMSETRNS
jgi:hypothetical protein